MPSTPKSTAKPGLGSRSVEPDLSFLSRTPRERKEKNNLLSANDRRGALAAEDLRKSISDQPARTKASIVKQSEAPVRNEARQDIGATLAGGARPQAPAKAATPETPQRDAANAPTSERPARVPDDKKTLSVGSSIRISGGHITNCDTLHVAGHVEAELDDARLLEVTDAGTFTGSASVDLATIEGMFDGELTVRDRLVITASGRVSGKIRYARIEVQPGGVVLGDLGSLPEH